MAEVTIARPLKRSQTEQTIDSKKLLQVLRSWFRPLSFQFAVHPPPGPFRGPFLNAIDLASDVSHIDRSLADITALFQTPYRPLSLEASSCTEPEKVGLGWVPGGSKHRLRGYLEV